MTFEQVFDERSARRLSEVSSDRDLMSAQLGGSIRVRLGQVKPDQKNPSSSWIRNTSTPWIFQAQTLFCSWSRNLVRVFTCSPLVPSKRTRAEISPFGLSFRLAPKDAITKVGQRAFASSSGSLIGCPLLVWSSSTFLTLSVCSLSDG